VVIFISLAATLVTPYRLNLYYFLVGYQNTFYQQHIKEWLSQFSFPFQYAQLGYLALVVLALGFYIYYARAKEKKWRINLWTLFLAVVFIFLSFKARRHFPLMLIATMGLMATVYGALFKMPRPQLFGRENFYANYWPKICLLFGIFFLALFQLLPIKIIKNPFTGFCGDYPCGAATFLQNHPAYDALPLFNEYGWGGFLIRVLPARKLFIDGRLPQVAFAGHTYLEEYYDFFLSAQRAGEKLSQYHIGLVLLPAKDEPAQAKAWEKIIFMIKDRDLEIHNYLRTYLQTAPDWQPIYQDATSIIYLKKD